MDYKVKSNSIFLVILILLYSGCGSYENVNMYQKSNLFDSNEKNLLKASNELSKTIDKNENTMHSKEYNEYPNLVLKKLLKDDKFYEKSEINFNVKVIKSPTLNAFALPNGNIYIHSGILAKLENEAQLALLLGHEMTHIIYKHSLKKKENLKSSAAVAQVFSIFTMPFDGGLTSLLLLNSSISGYSIESENEADRLGYEQIVKAGYDPLDASKLFNIMLKDIELNDKKEAYFFSTHPKVVDRIKSSTSIIESSYKGIKGETNKKEYLSYVKSILMENIETDLNLRRYKSAEYSIKTLEKEYGNNLGDVNYLQAELIRLKKDKNSFEEALKNYNLALEKNSSNYKIYKGLGYLYYQNDKKDEAKEAFKKYLSLNEEAKDKNYIAYYINQCNTKGK
ncbi:M48 family metalloprotease [Halarcobacter ebronensis]|uniref:Peptidase M48 domain-containing protein n=1 Tax=Halarcobacter ebronensis TaxID=1462615 RepID=A0A4Q1AK39_9BACT|nr:M48 family metalloprotease [Halarcobacter ebronensis]QKF81321.1 metallopeptidase, M48 family [Halarcobacter ebronensis]RXK04886.1 hypothetical protein CRV07_09865 [Halarcobacter ebronensis]